MKLTEKEWCIIHNALAVYQAQHPNIDYRIKLNILMDKVRDYFISK